MISGLAISFWFIWSVLTVQGAQQAAYREEAKKEMQNFKENPRATYHIRPDGTYNKR